MDKNKPKQRQSNIELLRMVAMFLVLLVHADYFSLGEPTVLEIRQTPLDAFLRIFFEAISIVCVNVFVLISGWLGIKPTAKGLCNFIFQCLFFLTGLYVITLAIGTSELSLKGLAGCVFATRLNWFIKAYLLLYILSPVLNAFVQTTSQRVYRYVLTGFFLFTCTYGWIGAAGFMEQGYSTLFFIGLYLLARYIRIYTPQWSLHKPSIYLSVYLACVMLVSFVCFILPLLFGKRFPLQMFSYICPTTIVGALALLLCFTKIEVQSCFINWCGISCFAVFLMHVSPSTLWHFKDLFVYLHNHLSVLCFWLTTFGVLSLIFIVSIFVDKIRIYVWDRLYIKLKPILNRFSADDTNKR